MDTQFVAMETLRASLHYAAYHRKDSKVVHLALEVVLLSFAKVYILEWKTKINS